MEFTDVETARTSFPQESPPDSTDRFTRSSPRLKKLFAWRPTDEKQLAQSEAVMLSRITYHQDFVADLNTIASVPIRRDGASRLNRTKTVMVLLHGFAGGLACWVQNWNHLAEQHELYALDLPGFGRSKRLDVKVDSQEGAMVFMCGYLERWFVEMDFGCPVIILGHSFGGFVAAHYAMRYGPERVKLLALVDPWGVDKTDPERIKRAPAHLRIAVKIFNTINPLAGLRAMGPMGPKIFRLIRPDFSERWKDYLEDPEAFYDYTYHCNAQLPPLGEKLFRACCRDVSAKNALIETLPINLSTDIHLVILYGSHTWINSEQGFTMADNMAAMGYSVKADTVMEAGHQVFTDNVKDFNRQILEAIKDILSSKNSTTKNS